MPDPSEEDSVAEAKANAHNDLANDLFSGVLKAIGLDGSLFQAPGR